MKKLLQTLAVFAVIVSPLALSPAASAAIECQVGYTGNNSKNICEKIVEYECEVKNTTDVEFTNKNDQEALSGGSLTSDNATTGTATSGAAGNSNSTKVNFKIDNTNNVCLVTYTSPPVTPTKPDAPKPTPVVPGKVDAGQGAVAPTTTTRVAPVAAPQVAGAGALPDTSASTTPAIIAGMLAALGAVTILARLAVMAYSHVKS